MIRDAYKRLYRDVEPGRALIDRTVRAASARGKRARGRAVLIPAVAALLALLGFAYAATQSGLLNWVFGPVEPMPEAKELVETVGTQVEGQFVSASVEEVLFDGQQGYVVWNLTTDSEEPLFFLRSGMEMDGFYVADGYDERRSSVYGEVTSEQYRRASGLTTISPGVYAAGLLGGDLSDDTFRGVNSFGLYKGTLRDYLYDNPGLTTLEAPSEIKMSVLVFRAKAPIYIPPTEPTKVVGEVPPLAIESLDDAATYGLFYFDRVLETFVETHDNPLTFGGIVTEVDTTLPPGEVRVHETISGKFLGTELWMEEEDSLLPRMGLKEDWDRMRMDLSLREAERMRWYGMLLEKMGYGEIVEELTITFPLAPKSALKFDASISGQTAFDLDFFRAEVPSADFNALGGDIHIKVWPDYGKADPRIAWLNTAFDAYLYRGGKQIGDQPAHFDINSLASDSPGPPWFEETPADYVPPELYEGHLLIDAVGEYPDTIVIVPTFADSESFGSTLSIPGDYSMTIHLQEP